MTDTTTTDTTTTDTTTSEHPEAARGEEPARGALWTLIAAGVVFAAILLSVLWYLLPRLSGEPPSANADLKIAAASAKPVDGWISLRTHSGDQFFVSPDSVVTAADVRTFRGRYSEDGDRVLRLNFTEDGAQRLQRFTRDNNGEHLAVVINGELVSCPVIRSEISDSAELHLGALPQAAAEEIFARLTQ